MNTFRIHLLVFAFISTSVFASAGTFCRFEHKGTTAYGEVANGRVEVLTLAPWTSLKKTGITYPLDQVKLLAPSQPGVIAGLSKSYRSAWPDGGEPPAVRWFIKPPGAAAAPSAPLVLPDSLDEAKVEVELVIVIGRTVKNADESEAAAAIFGYTVGNDIVGQVTSYQTLTGDSTDRQESVLATGLKAADGFAPFGPFIQTDLNWKDREKQIEVISTDPGREVIDLTNTSDLIYKPAKIVSDLSKVMTLRPGDIIFSGTNKAYPVRAGDRVNLSIKGIGGFTTVVQDN